MDLVIRNARLPDRASEEALDIEVSKGRIVAIEREADQLSWHRRAAGGGPEARRQADRGRAALTDRSARLLNLADYGLAVGRPADIVVLNAQSPEQAIAEISQPVAAFKAGRQTVAWALPELLRPK